MAAKKKKKPAAKKKIDNTIKVKAALAPKEPVEIKKEGNASSPKPGETKEKTVDAELKTNIKKESKEKSSKKKPKQKLKKMKLKKRLGILWRKSTASLKNRFSKINTKIQTKRLPRRTEKIIALVTLLVVIAAGLFFTFHALQYKVPDIAIQKYMGINEPDVNVRKIEISLDEQLQRAKETKAKGDKKEFKFFANNKITIDEWYDKIPLEIANVSSNKCIFLVTILDDSDQIVYRSMGLKAGQYIPSVQLFNEMDYGEYKLKVIVAAYEPKTFTKIGVQYMNLKLVIGIEQAAKQDTSQSTG